MQEESHNPLLLYILLTLLEGLLCFCILLNIPKDPTNDWLFGYSQNRIILLGITLTIVLGLALLTIKLWNQRQWAMKLTAAFTRLFHRKNIRPLAILISALIFSFAIFFLSLMTLLTEIYFKSIFTRFFPFVLWLSLASFHTLVIIILAFPGEPPFYVWLQNLVKRPVISIPFTLLLLASTFFATYLDHLPIKTLPTQIQASPKDFHLLLTHWLTYNILLLLTLAAFLWTPLWSRWSEQRWFSITLKVTFGLGIFLIMINLSGLVIPVQLPQGSIDRILNELRKSKNESNEQFVERVTNLVHQCMVRPVVNNKNNVILAVPFHENYILALTNLIATRGQPYYEFCDYRKALKRGIGLCSQKSLILENVLEENGIQARIVGLDGHVVVTAHVNPEKPVAWWILDPDYGVLIDQSLTDIEQNPANIQTYYQARGYSQAVIDGLIKIYDKQGNVVSESGVAFLGRAKCQQEQYAYVLIWLIPIFLMTPYVLKRIYHAIKVQ